MSLCKLSINNYQILFLEMPVLIIIFSQGHASTDFTCTNFTIDGNIQLGEDDTITVTANSLQSIMCRNNTPEISDIAYNFHPPNAVVIPIVKDYIHPHKYEIKFFLNSSATLTIRGINSTNNNDANYTLEINIKVIQGIQEYT